MVLDTDNKIFMVYIAVLIKSTIMLIYLFCKTQIVFLINTVIFAKYFNFLNIFFSNFAIILLEYVKINDHPINLLDHKELFHSPIFSLKLLELEILKTYIEANLVSNFIKSSKFFASIPLLLI